MSEKTQIPINQSGVDLKDIQNQSSNDFMQEIEKELNPESGPIAEDNIGGPEFADEPPVPINPVDLMSPEEKRKRKLLLLNMRRYLNHKRFGQYLKTYHVEDCEFKTNEEIETLLDDIRFDVSCANSSSMGNAVFTSGLHTYENIMCGVGVKCQGLTYNLMQSEDFQAVLDELSLEYGSAMATKPIYRFGLIVVAGTYNMHNANVQKEEIRKLMTGKNIDDIIKDPEFSKLQ